MVSRRLPKYLVKPHQTAPTGLVAQNLPKKRKTK